jgi:hypothetical protein
MSWIDRLKVACLFTVMVLIAWLIGWKDGKRV